MTIKSNICIAWEILHRMSFEAIMDCSFWPIYYGLILYVSQYPEYDALPLGKKVLWYWIGIRGAVVVSVMV